MKDFIGNDVGVDDHVVLIQPGTVRRLNIGKVIAEGKSTLKIKLIGHPWKDTIQQSPTQVMKVEDDVACMYMLQMKQPK